MKVNTLVLVAIASVILGLGGGYLIGVNAEKSAHEKEHSSEEGHHDDSHSDEKAHSDDMNHMHESIEVPAENAPTVELTVTEDKKSGWNVSLKTTNYKFTPENANREDVSGEGHAHLYVGDEKFRLYGPDFHYPGKFDGTKTFKVTLNSNSHSEFTVDGVAVSDEVEVTHEH